MPHILAMDQGTTSSRAIIFNERGHSLATAQKEFTQHFPKPGWVEHDADEIWRTQRLVAQQALEQARLHAADLAAIAITNQRETTVLWHRDTGRAIARAIVWQDRRTASLCDDLRRAGHEATIREKTGLLLDPYFSGTKIQWLLDHVPDARKLADAGRLCFGTIDSWLIWNLTAGQVHATDPSNASRTLLFNIHSQQWDDELLKLLRIPRSILPEVRASSGAFGVTDLLGESIAISGVAGDQQAALFGQLCLEPGMLKTTYGTGCFLLCNTGTSPRPSSHRLLSTCAWQRHARMTYALEGSVFVGGAAVQWLRDGLGLIQKSSDIQALASEVTDTQGVYFVPAFTGLGAPVWDADARGLIIGITRGTTRAHLAHATLEGIAHQVASVVEVMRQDMGGPLREMRVDGGAAANDLLMQIQSDLLQMPLVRPRQTETTALGAAYLAGLAAGVWADEKALAAQWQVDRRFEPVMSGAEAIARRRRWAMAVERARGWAGDSQ